MDNYDLRIQLRRSDFQRSRAHRGTLVIVLCGLLCILGIFTYNFNASAETPPISAAASHKTSAVALKAHAVTQKNAKTPTKVHQASKPTTTSTQVSSQQQILPPHMTGYPIFNGNTHLPEIALTFDDGPNPIYTAQILAVLQNYGVRATFFDVGYLVRDYPALARAEMAQGNVVGNHSWSHPDLTKFSTTGIVSQMVAASDAIQSATGVRPVLFRPPYGAFNRTVLAYAKQYNMAAILWNDTASDYATPGINVIVQRILGLARNGAIVLLHDGGGFRAQTVAALPIIIETLHQRGYRFVTIPQLLRDSVTSGENSSQQSSGNIEYAPSFSLIPTPMMWKRELLA